jgi:hypothetical protein
LAERTYTITVRVQQTFARKVDRRSHKEKVVRAIEGALPDGWDVVGSTINLASKTAKSEAKKQARREKAKAESAKRREEARKTKERIAQSERDRKAWERRTEIVDSGHWDDAFKTWALDGERMKPWKIHLAFADESMKCWDAHVYEGKVPLNAGQRIFELHPTALQRREVTCTTRTAQYLRKRGCGVAFIPPNKMALLHELAHYRMWKNKAESKAHCKKWMLVLLNLIKKYLPEAFDENARIIDALAGKQK